MSPQFGVKWAAKCFLCHNPVDVRVEVSCDDMMEVVSDMTTFNHHHPIDLTHNEMFWKIRGQKAYRCCRCCGERPWPIPNLMKREVGAVKPRHPIRSESMSGNDIYTWFKSFNLYMKMEPEGKFKAPTVDELRAERTGLILRLL